ncbi:VanW family protein [Sporolactobacillus kofuensis]|uniref:VanW family protein n=1 Tax=Sporolactobacillus kofuensis TaxID=269672 RepID=A0ABW1WCN0_9BACL|nr:VanW family protein [Sporolactobacillus kofuensis]MCO7175347.1 VanW family protein [Sporolactobacillus kofuensis]
MRLLMLAGMLILAQQQPVVLSDHLIIKHHETTLSTVNRDDFTTLFSPLIDQEKVNQLMNRLNQEVSQPPINAKINDHGTIDSEQTGFKLYRSKFKDRFYRYYYGHGSAQIEVPLLTVYPKVDGELLAHIRTEQIGHYTTFFNSGNKSRAHNIELAAQALDGHVVFPNETFSFNQTVGMRTKKKGYLPARVIVRGEYSEGVGGGICQVSSTLFNAVDRAGLKIIERYAHSRRVAYVPLGRDATVSWYGPDFRFRNNYNQPILIRAHKHGGSISFAIYSSDVINVLPRKIPNASSQLPKETKHTRKAQHLDMH